jgi:purine-binding chemotaxis protein CheW
MDIAKIRKKAKEKQKERAGTAQPPAQPAEPAVEPSEEQQQVSLPETLPESPWSTEEMPEPGGIIEEAAPTLPVPPPADECLPGEAAAEEEEEPAPAEETEEEAEAVVELLTFSLSTEEFAFRVSDVEEIIRHQPIVKVPTMPDYVLGITSLRGKILPVIDLKARIVFGDGRGAASVVPLPEGRKKILIILGPKGPIGVTVDRGVGVVRLPEGKVVDPPAHLREEERKFVDGVVILDKRFVSIVRCEETLKIEVT